MPFRRRLIQREMRAEGHPFYLALGYEKTETAIVYRKILARTPR
jgi:hypothetical protein